MYKKRLQFVWHIFFSDMSAMNNKYYMKKYKMELQREKTRLRFTSAFVLFFLFTFVGEYSIVKMFY